MKFEVAGYRRFFFNFLTEAVLQTHICWIPDTMLDLNTSIKSCVTRVDKGLQRGNWTHSDFYPNEMSSCIAGAAAQTFDYY